MRSSFASPGANYLERLGELVYAVGSLEWLLLGDLATHAAVLPPEMNVSALAGTSTGGIASRILEAAPLITDAAVQHYYSTGAASLKEVAELRNSVMHARPATAPGGEQGLYRWRAATSASPHQVFFIDDARLDAILDRIAELTGAVSALRPPVAS